MNTLLVLLPVCLAAVAKAQYEEIVLTAEKTIRHGVAPPSQASGTYYPNYGQPVNSYGEPTVSNSYAAAPANVNPAYYPMVFGANPTLVYVPQTGQIVSAYPIQAGTQFYAGQPPAYNEYGQNNGYGNPPAYGGSGASGTYGASGPTEDAPVGFLSDAYIQAINQKQNTWTAVSNFEDKQEVYDYIGDLCGVRDPAIGKPNILAPVSYNTKDIPKEFDPRTHEPWKVCESLHQVRDQGSCGSCWAIAAAESMTDRICIASEGKIKVNMSTQDLVECCRTCGYGCDGGFPGAAWNFYKESGIVSGGEYDSPKDQRGCKPYTVPPCAHHNKKSERQACQKGTKTPPCKKKCESDLSYDADLHFGDISYSIDNKVESIQLEILNYGPIECAFEVYEDFVSYGKGVYKKTSNKKVGGHAVKLFGWGVENGVDFWWCVNSWNTDWGELGGYFKIARGTNECNIEKDCVAGKPKLNKLMMETPQAFGTVKGVPTSFVNTNNGNGPKVIHV